MGAGHGVRYRTRYLVSLPGMVPGTGTGMYRQPPWRGFSLESRQYVVSHPHRREFVSFVLYGPYVAPAWVRKAIYLSR
jgi:hypothetical protein